MHVFPKSNIDIRKIFQNEILYFFLARKTPMRTTYVVLFLYFIAYFRILLTHVQLCKHSKY